MSGYRLVLLVFFWGGAFLLCVADATAAQGATERRVYPGLVDASSFLLDSTNPYWENFHPNYVADGDPKTAWTTGDFELGNTGVGEALELSVGPEAGFGRNTTSEKSLGVIADVTKVRLRVQNGYHKSPKLYTDNSRVREAEITLMPSMVTKTIVFADDMQWKEYAFDQTKGPLETITLKVKRLYPGQKYADLAISEIEVFVTTPEPLDEVVQTRKREALVKWINWRTELKALPWVGVTALPFGTCGFKEGGFPICWGRINAWVEGPLMQITADCVLSADGKAECGDAPEFGGPPRGAVFKQIASNESQRCGVAVDGKLWCWKGPCLQRPVDATCDKEYKDRRYHQVVMTEYYECALRQNGEVECWGLSEPYSSIKFRAVPVPPTGVFAQLSAGLAHVCGLRPTGEVVCWGLGTADPGDTFLLRNDAQAPECGQAHPPLGKFTQISTGERHTCAIEAGSGRVRCWGAGAGGRGPKRCPVFGGADCRQATPPPGRFKQVSAGAFHTCGLREDGKIVCWGAGKSRTNFRDQTLKGAECGQSLPP